MNAVGRLGSYISRGVYTVSGPFHPFGGAVDIIVVEQQDGSFKSSPWYVRFGKFQGVLKTKEKVVTICVNGIEADFHMYLDHKGEAYFLREGDVEEGESVLYPSSSGEDTDGQSSNRRPLKSKSCNYDAGEPNSVSQIDVSNGKIVARTGSRRSRIFGLFGRRSIKENNFREEEDCPGVVRSSSLERAEFAADLLEVQWSTNLATNKNRKDKTSRFSAQNALDGKADEDFQINGGQSQVNSFVHDSAGNNSDHPVLHDETESCNREMGNSCEPGCRESECSAEKTSAQISCLSTLKQAIETSNSEGSSVEEACEVHPIISRKTVEHGVGNADHDEDAKDAISKMTISVSSISHSTELGACPSKQFNDEQVLDERDVVLPGQGVSKAQTAMNRVQSFLYCGMSESSRLGLDGSGEQTHETLYVSHGECGEVHVHAQILPETTGQISEANTESESGVLVAKESSNNLEYLRDRDCCDFLNNAMALESEVTSMNFVRNNVISESLSSIDIHLITSNSIESLETEVLEVTHQETVIKRLAEDINKETEVMVEVRETHCQQTNPCNSCVPDYNDVELEEPRMVPESSTQMVSIDPICSVEEDELRSIRTTSSFRNSPHQVQHVENLRDENNMRELEPSQEVSISPSESSEEEQFPFSDLDDFKLGNLQCTESTSPDCVENENHSSVTQEGIEVVNESLNKDYESYSSSDKLAQENLPNDFEDLVEKSRKILSPIDIPGSQKVSGMGVGRLAESLPNMWSDNDDLVACDLHPPCHSLDSNSKSLKWTLPRNTVSGCIVSDAEKEHQLAKEESIVDDIQISGELNNVPINPAIEISLCKHLLHEGMGADAASQAFDAEKLDMDKFSSVGLDIIKNDRLVVRINGHYFPWEAAAPIVLGMVAFGSEHIFEPQGVIPVDRVEKTRAGDPSKVIVDSNGRWGIWPFKRSRTIKAIQPGLNGTRSFDAESASESTSSMDGDKNVLKSIVTKRKLRAITPTSEQLASLNLKEGRNTVIFTFSTAMLGEQQVEARIFLWKWNTRIVISDVDGTITKSDVLGQFMPLVGVDWSQTGVAHLFSAIKENGYQMLFLSARAISQAYHTRRFLFNIKQDGKALPDGPVVISPDGLFPSLFREVIRRAPHEFKIACLEDIRALFPCDCNPFYAGFGNRLTDEISYLKVGIPKGKIFIINPKGQVAVNRRVDTKSYTSLHTLVHGMFPPMSSNELEDFNSWNYWRLPPPVFDI